MGKADTTSDAIISVIFGIVSLQFLFPMNYFLPLDRRLSGLCGSAVCAVVLVLIPNSEKGISQLVDIDVLIILVAIMVINFVLMQQKLVDVYIKSMQNSIRTNPNFGFWTVSFISFIVSPFITNDGLCLLLVNPVMDALDGQDITPRNRFFYLLTISSAANIGSVMTFSGNPQNILIAKSLSPLMNGGTFFGLMIIPAFSMCLLQTIYLNFMRLREDREEFALDPSAVANDMKTPLLMTNESTPLTLPIDIRLSETFVDLKEAMVGGAELVGELNIKNLSSSRTSVLSFLLFTALIVVELTNALPLTFIFCMVALLMVATVLLVPYYRGNPSTDIETQKPISNKSRRLLISKYIDDLFLEIDYNLLVIFTGLFIVSGCMVNTYIPRFFWKQVAGSSPFGNFKSVILICLYTIVGSQLVGNVALIYMVTDDIEKLDDNTQRFGWLMLSWVATVAGNFTLAGSAANIIVAERAARHPKVPVLITSYRHGQIMSLFSIFTITVGAIVIYLEALMLGYVG